MAAPLVEPDWLKDRLPHIKTFSCENCSLVLLDTTWTQFRDDNGYDTYLKSHIPGAQHFNMNACLSPSKEIPRSLPEPELFEKYIKSLGINENTHVIVYDRDDGDMIISTAATRVWWMLRVHGHENVSTLNGGFMEWNARNFPVTSEEEKFQKSNGNFVSTINNQLFKTYEQMTALVNNPFYQIVDTRLEENFLGTVPEPSEFTKIMLEDRKLGTLKEGEIIKGHMPGATNIPFTFLINHKTQKYFSKEHYEKMFQSKEIELKKPIIATCYIGHSACQLALVAAICGKMDAMIFYGSWTEWGQRMARAKKTLPCEHTGSESLKPE